MQNMLRVSMLWWAVCIGVLKSLVIFLVSISTQLEISYCPDCLFLPQINDSDENRVRLEEICGMVASLAWNMHLPSFGSCVDRAVEDVLVGFLSLKMFGSGTKKWFVRKQKRQQHRSGRRPCTRKKKKRWAAKILKQHRQKILSELDVNTVLPYLVYDKVFSLGEYKEILGHESNKKRTEIFLDRLSSKGPAAFCSFCSVLEEVCPHLLTCFLLEGEGTAINEPLVTQMRNTKWSSWRTVWSCTTVCFEKHFSFHFEGKEPSWSPLVCSRLPLICSLLSPYLVLHLMFCEKLKTNETYKAREATFQ